MPVTTLSNGVRVLSQELPDYGSVTVGIWVENGSRYERPEHAGISHFLEHLFFKGTTRRTAAKIAEEIDAVGGVLNAFTGKEYTCYYAKVLAEHLPLALDVLTDIFTQSLFPEEEIERERSVIIQEISQAEDTPDDFIHDLFNQAYWPGHPLARPIAGTAGTVSGLHRSHFIDFMAERYRPNRVLVSAAGNVRHEELTTAVERFLGPLTGRNDLLATGTPQPKPGLFVHEKPLEQVHLCLGGPGISQRDPDRYVAHIVNLALGGGMSSRLFQEIRERRGRAYTVYSFLSSYLDAGYTGIYVGTSAEWAAEVIEAALGEVDRLRRDGLSVDELGRAKSQMKGNLLLGLETSDSRMSRLARNEIYYGRDVPLDEVAAGIDAVTNEQVLEMADRLFRPGERALTVLGKDAHLDAGILGG